MRIENTVPHPDRNAALRVQYDHRTHLLKAIHLITSLFRQMLFSIGYGYHRAISKKQPSTLWNTESQGLVVLLHGLRSDPAAWFPQLSLLRKHQKIDVFNPLVHKRGLCALEEATLPLLPRVIDYIQTHPGRPICLIGMSNGSRIATWLETRLREIAPQTPVMVSTISGVHLGSSRMNQLEKFKMKSALYPAALQQELKFQSEYALNLLNRVRAPLPPNCAPRKFEFYATTDDLLIPDLASSLPEINQGERFYVLQGHSHDSIVSAVAEQQIDSCLSWILQRI